MCKRPSTFRVHNFALYALALTPSRAHIDKKKTGGKRTCPDNPIKDGHAQLTGACIIQRLLHVIEEGFEFAKRSYLGIDTHKICIHVAIEDISGASASDAME